MKVTVLRNVKLIDGELFYDQEENYETENIHISLVKWHNLDKPNEYKILILIGKAFSGEQILIGKNDEVHIC